MLVSNPPALILDSALSPFERAAEIIFGVLMALSVTAAYEITAGQEVDVRGVMLAALGCNLAWGLIDGVVYLLQQQFERFREHRTLLELRAITGDDAFRERVLQALPSRIGKAITPDTLVQVRRVVDAYDAHRPPLWKRHEFAVAGIICLLVF